MRNHTGLKRFTNQLHNLKNLLLLAKEAQHPALTFYSSNARQILFYLEALSRIYKEIHDEKLFEGFKDDFKTLEDQLGKIDYYDASYKELAVLPNFPKKISDHLLLNYQQELQKLGNLLVANGWLGNKLVEINEGLIKADWLNPDEEPKAIAKTIAKEIKSIEKDYKTGKLNFKDLEHGVHEFRRQIRWISIYAQALDGLIQLKADSLSEKLSIYLTKDIIESKFNVMPSSKGLSATINLSQSAFYALSWMIAKSGDLKDEGLKLICVEECMKTIKFLPELEIQAEAKRLLPDLKITPKEIKAEMKVLAHQFLTHDCVLDILRDGLKAYYKN